MLREWSLYHDFTVRESLTTVELVKMIRHAMAASLFQYHIPDMDGMAYEHEALLFKLVALKNHGIARARQGGQVFLERTTLHQGQTLASLLKNEGGFFVHNDRSFMETPASDWYFVLRLGEQICIATAHAEKSWTAFPSHNRASLCSDISINYSMRAHLHQSVYLLTSQLRGSHTRNCDAWTCTRMYGLC